MSRRTYMDNVDSYVDDR